jgi:hypothetical protein
LCHGPVISERGIDAAESRVPELQLPPARSN